MALLRLSLISIDEFRELQTGSADVEQHVTLLANQASPQPTPRPKRLFGIIKRKPKPAPFDPDVPTEDDARNLARGKYIAPERLSAAWTLTRMWLDRVAWASFTLPIVEPTINDLDFELASWGVETHFALRRLLNDNLSIPLQNPKGQVSGYIKYEQALAMREAWLPAIPSLSPQNAAVASQVCAWLHNLEQFAFNAHQARRKAPDLIAWFSGYPIK